MKLLAKIKADPAYYTFVSVICIASVLIFGLYIKDTSLEFSNNKTEGNVASSTLNRYDYIEYDSPKNDDKVSAYVYGYTESKSKVDTAKLEQQNNSNDSTKEKNVSKTDKVTNKSKLAKQEKRLEKETKEKSTTVKKTTYEAKDVEKPIDKSSKDESSDKVEPIIKVNEDSEMDSLSSDLYVPFKDLNYPIDGLMIFEETKYIDKNIKPYTESTFNEFKKAFEYGESFCSKCLLDNEKYGDINSFTIKKLKVGYQVLFIVKK